MPSSIEVFNLNTLNMYLHTRMKHSQNKTFYSEQLTYLRVMGILIIYRDLLTKFEEEKPSPTKLSNYKHETKSLNNLSN